MPEEPEQPGPAPEVFYRYEDYREAHNVGYDDPYYVSVCRVRLLELPVIARTPKGVWLKTSGDFDMLEPARRFVLLSGRKRYALPTKEEARASFIARKTAQRRHLLRQVGYAEDALRYVGADRDGKDLPPARSEANAEELRDMEDLLATLPVN